MNNTSLSSHRVRVAHPLASNWKASLTESANADRDNAERPDHPTAVAYDAAANRVLGGAS